MVRDLGQTYVLSQRNDTFGNHVNGVVFDALKSAFEVGLGTLRGMALPFVVPSLVHRRYEKFLPLPGSENLGNDPDSLVRTYAEQLRYNVGSAVGLLANASLITLADLADDKFGFYIASILVGTNSCSVIYENMRYFANRATAQRWTAALQQASPSLEDRT